MYVPYSINPREIYQVSWDILSQDAIAAVRRQIVEATQTTKEKIRIKVRLPNEQHFLSVDEGAWASISLWIKEINVDIVDSSRRTFHCVTF